MEDAIMMKKFVVVTFVFLFFLGSSINGSNLLNNIRLLKDKKARGEITDSEYQEMLSLILSSGNEARPQVRSNNRASSRLSSNRVNAQVNIHLAKYWRAKDLINLSTDLTLKSRGRTFEGQVLAKKENQIVIAFPVEIPSGNQKFQLIYRAKVKKSNQNNWQSKTFCAEFESSVVEDGEISIVMEFIEQKDRGGNYAAIKILNYNQYVALIKQRREREKNQKTLEKSFLKKLFGK
jgi:hypothetical protein